MSAEDIKVEEPEVEKPPPEIDWGSEELKKAQEAIDENRYDLESWSILISEAQLKWIGDTRPFFERLVTTFPSTGRYWKIYIELEMKARNFEKVEKLFQRCLIKVLNIDLWKLYLAYVKETKASLPTYKEKMVQVYEFAIDKIGLDISSYPIWNDYVNFLKSVKAIGSYAEYQKISAVRKVYQKGVVNPMTNIEQFWNDYMAYEQNINPMIAETMSLERSRDYTNSRRVSKEFEAITRGLNKHFPSVPPTKHPDELRQVDLWKKYINWEKSNPLRTKNKAILTRRVVFAYEQCLLCLGHHPDAWYEAAQFFESSTKMLKYKRDEAAAKMDSDEAGCVYERAIGLMLDKDRLFYSAYSENMKSTEVLEHSHRIYCKFIEFAKTDPNLVGRRTITIEKFTHKKVGLLCLLNYPSDVQTGLRVRTEMIKIIEAELKRMSALQGEMTYTNDSFHNLAVQSLLGQSGYGQVQRKIENHDQGDEEEDNDDDEETICNEEELNSNEEELDSDEEDDKQEDGDEEWECDEEEEDEEDDDDEEEEWECDEEEEEEDDGRRRRTRSTKVE